MTYPPEFRSKTEYDDWTEAISFERQENRDDRILYGDEWIMWEEAVLGKLADLARTTNPWQAAAHMFGRRGPAKESRPTSQHG
jgi:hypothetical protein